jgi:hypothetical protein
MDWLLVQPEAPYQQPLDIEVSAQSMVSNSKTLVHVVMLTVCDILQMEISSLDDERLSPLRQMSIEASEPQLSLSPPRQSTSDEGTTIKKHPRTKMNSFKSVRMVIRLLCAQWWTTNRKCA